MDNFHVKKRIAILGGGPSGMFLYKRLIESGVNEFEIHIFERKGYLGAGMPYSEEGANEEHVTNVSDNEIPVIMTSVEDWIKTAPAQTLKRFHVDPENFNSYKVLPRLFFGEYLSAQFQLLQEQATKEDIATVIHLNTNITNITDYPDQKIVELKIEDQGNIAFDCIILCTGHNWPKKEEGVIPRYFDSPYPPKKLAFKMNYAVGIKGASLTAIDALKTIARFNGHFVENASGKLTYKRNGDAAGFKLVLHSRNGLLPALRFHLEDSHLGKAGLMSKKEMIQLKMGNDGFISLDIIFEKDFKEMFLEKDPAFYSQVKDMNLETFVEMMMEIRAQIEPFALLKQEYAEAEQSIKNHQSILWKEKLAVLSFAMNYPAKYFSAEDMQRLQKVLMPLISIVIAFIPQGSCRELMALHDAGVLSIICVGEDSEVVAIPAGGANYHYKNEDGEAISEHFDTFVNCVGQPHLSFQDFPFQGLVKEGTISPARLKFHSPFIGKEEMENGNELVEKDGNGRYFLHVPGITINDSFQAIDQDGLASERIYIMAVPYIGGYNPDYSGIDFSESASEEVVKRLLHFHHNDQVQKHNPYFYNQSLK